MRLIIFRKENLKYFFRTLILVYIFLLISTNGNWDKIIALSLNNNFVVDILKLCGTIFIVRFHTLLSMSVLMATVYVYGIKQNISDDFFPLSNKEKQSAKIFSVFMALLVLLVPIVKGKVYSIENLYLLYFDWLLYFNAIYYGAGIYLSYRITCYLLKRFWFYEDKVNQFFVSAHILHLRLLFYFLIRTINIHIDADTYGLVTFL